MTPARWRNYIHHILSAQLHSRPVGVFLDHICQKYQYAATRPALVGRAMFCFTANPKFTPDLTYYRIKFSRAFLEAMVVRDQTTLMFMGTQEVNILVDLHELDFSKCTLAEMGTCDSSSGPTRWVPVEPVTC